MMELQVALASASLRRAAQERINQLIIAEDYVSALTLAQRTLGLPLAARLN